MAISTIRKGRDEVRAGARPQDAVKVRRNRRTSVRQISDGTVAKLLREHGYRLQTVRKTVEGRQPPDRNGARRRLERPGGPTSPCRPRFSPNTDLAREGVTVARVLRTNRV